MNALTNSQSHPKSNLDLAVSKNARRFHDMPGPTKFQLLRGFIPGGKFHGHSLKDFGNICRKEFGDLYKISGGYGVPSIVMSFNPDHFEKVFRTEGFCPFRRPSASFSYYRENVRKDFYKDMLGLTISNNEEWKRIREAVNPILTDPSNVKMFFPKLLRINKDFVERIREIRSSETFEAPDDFLQEIKRWTFENILAIALDKEFGFIKRNRDNPEFLRLLKNTSRTTELCFELDVMPPIWKFVSTASSKEMMSILDETQIILEKYVNEAIENMKVEEKEEDKSVLQKLVTKDRKLACVVVMDMLGAGLDTTTTVFTGVLLSIATNKDKQEILRAEINERFPHKTDLINVEVLKDMPYLKACIKESIRIYPAGAGTARRTNQDLEIDGYKIPKGVDFIINSEAVMKDAKYFPDPEKFIPERWLKGDCDKTHHFAYLPFGYGPRMCIAKKITDFILEIGLIEILRNFKVEYNYPPGEVFTSYLLNTPKAPLRFKFTDIEVK